MSFLYVFQKMVELFLIIIVGYIASKCGVMDKTARLKLTGIVLNITVPALILTSAMGQESPMAAKDILFLLLVAMASYILIFAVAFIGARLLAATPSQEGVYRFMLAFGNVGFIGFPVTQAIFGDSAVFYTSVFNIPFNLLAYSVGVMFLDAKGQGSKLSYKLLLTPCMVASVLSIILALCQLSAPPLITDTLDMVAAITTPAALLIIGSSLAELPVREMAGSPRVYLFALTRLVILPLLTYLIFGLFVRDELLLGVAVIVTGMPVATNGTMLSLQYGADEKLMAQGTFITTLLSVLTIPLLAMFIQYM